VYILYYNVQNDDSLFQLWSLNALNTFATQFSHSFKKNKFGQAALIVTLIICVVILVTVNVSISMLNNQSTKLLITSTKSLQSYYVAMHGIQEAMATRMVPRSNQMNFTNPAAAAYPHSGRVYNNVNFVLGQTPVNTNLLGIYRYVVVGGDAFRQRLGGAQNINQNLLRFASFPDNSSPFYIISNGTTCSEAPIGGTRGESAAQPVMNFPFGNLGPIQCPRSNRPNTQLVPEQTTIVARALIEREPNPLAPPPAGNQLYNLLPDRIQGLQAYRSLPTDPPGRFSLPTDVAQAGGAYIPGINRFITDTTPLSFEDVWRNTDPPRIIRVISTSRRTNPRNLPPAGAINLDPIGSIQFIEQFNNPNNVSNNITLNNPVPVGSTLIIAFDRPFEFRSIFNPNFNIPICLGIRNGSPRPNGNPNDCSLSVIANGDAANPLPVNFSPVLPGSSVLVIVPSLRPGAVRGTALPHSLIINNLRNYSGVNVSAQAVINFGVEGARQSNP
jgi:hypothetical protein